MSQFCVKFSYNQTIKKVIITKDQLSWENVCAILMRSFYLSEKEQIQLKYKDLENDEITVNSDEDLHEAYNLYFMKSLIKFFVHYSGVFSQNGGNEQSTGYSKIQRPLPFSGSLPGALESSQVRKRSNDILDSSKCELLDKDGSKSLPKVDMLKVSIDSNINIIELQGIFSEVFAETEVLQKIQEKLRRYISKENKDSNEVVEYSIETDYQAIANYMISTLSDVMNKKFSEDSSKPLSEEVLETSTKSNKEILSQASNQQEEKKEMSKECSTSLNVSMKESLYGGSIRDFPQISKEKDSLTYSLNSSMENKALSNMGVRLVLKYESGKPRLVSIPASDYSIIEAHPPNEDENLTTSVNFSKNSELKEEKLEESVCNVALSLKKKASTERKPHEFANNILKANLHDLDDDLPAPYNVKFVKKYEKGMTTSIYEKIN